MDHSIVDILNNFKDLGLSILVKLNGNIGAPVDPKKSPTVKKRFDLLESIEFEVTKNESIENIAKFFQVLLNIQDDISKYICDNERSSKYLNSNDVFESIMKISEKRFGDLNDSTSQFHWSKMQPFFKKLKDTKIFPRSTIIRKKVQDYERTREYVEDYFKDFIKVKAVSNGSCFFDSFSQSYNQQQGLKEGDEGYVKYKGLREKCKDFAMNAKDEDLKWLKKAIQTRHDQFSKENIDSKNIRGNVESFDGTVDSYIKSIVEDEFWGAPDLEGIILCKEYNVKLHIMEKFQSFDIQGDDKETCIIIGEEDRKNRKYNHNLYIGTEKALSLDSSPSEVIAGYKRGENESGCALIRDDSNILEIFGDDVVHIVNEGSAHFEPLISKNKNLHRDKFSNRSNFPNDDIIRSRITEEVKLLRIHSMQKAIRETEQEFLDKIETYDKFCAYSLVREELSNMNELELSHKLTGLKNSLNNGEFTNLNENEKVKLSNYLSNRITELPNREVKQVVENLSNDILEFFQVKEFLKFEKKLQNSKRKREDSDEENSPAHSIINSGKVSRVSDCRGKA